jgi:hypothetical protein
VKKSINCVLQGVGKAALLDELLKS